MARATRHDKVFAPYLSGDFAAARRPVRQAASEYCAAPSPESFERLRRIQTALFFAPNVLSGPAEGSAAAEAFTDGVVLRKLLLEAVEAGTLRESETVRFSNVRHLESIRHGVYGLADGLASCADRLDRGHKHDWLIAFVRKMLAAYYRRHDHWSSCAIAIAGREVESLETFVARLVAVGDLSAPRSLARTVVHLHRRQVHEHRVQCRTALTRSLHSLADICEHSGDAHGAHTCRMEAAAGHIFTKESLTNRPYWI
ncbi:hypothetical protein [Kitasatospora sp. NPDC085879]|jgi:hypothetical protein|uniref:hypothetical protein n=1 Tax=Kitasatospora sp. NPDC085879 TaxID=3154769 RepID=UPI00342991FD